MSVQMKLDVDGNLVPMTANDIASLPRPEDATPPPVRSSHIAWFKAALAEMRKLDAVNAAVALQGQAKQVLWEYATTVKETDTDVIDIATALKIDLSTVFDKADEIRLARS